MANPERLNMPEGNGSPDQTTTGSAATAVAERPHSEPAFEIKPGVLNNPNLTSEQYQQIRAYQQQLRRSAPSEASQAAFMAKPEFIMAIDPATGKEVKIPRISGGADRPLPNQENVDAARERELAALQRQRVDATDPEGIARLDDAMRLFYRRQERERMSISAMQRVSAWIDDDEGEQRTVIAQQIRDAHPEYTNAQVMVEVGTRKPDSRKFEHFRQEVENVIRIVEQDMESGFSGAALQEIYQGVGILVDKGYPELATEVTLRIESRAKYRSAMLAAKYEEAGKIGAALTDFLPKHHKEVMSTPGVKQAIQLLEKSDAKGDPGLFYRSKDVKVTDLKWELLQAIRKDDPNQEAAGIPEISRKNDGGFGIASEQFGPQTELLFKYVFDALDKSIDDGQTTVTVGTILEQLQSEYGVQIRGSDGLINLRFPEQGDAERFKQAVLFANRAMDIAREANIISGFAVDCAGPVDKKGNLIGPTKIPLKIPDSLPEDFFDSYVKKAAEDFAQSLLTSDKLTAAEKERLSEDKRREIAELKQRLYGDQDPESLSAEEKKAVAKNLFSKYAGKTIDLKNLSPEDRDALKLVRKFQGFLISEAYDYAWTDFYIDHWDEIDAEKSFSGNDVPRELWQIIHKPVYFNKIATRNPGSIPEMRKYAYMGVSTALKATAAEGTYGLFNDDWNDIYGIIRLVGNDKIPKGDKGYDTCYKDGKQFLNSLNAVLDPKGEFVTEFKGIWAGFMSVAEKQWKVGRLAEGALKFMTDSKIARKYDFKRLNQPKAESVIQNYRNANTISKAQADIIERGMYGPTPIREIKSAMRKIVWIEAIWEILSGIIKKGTEGMAK